MELEAERTEMRLMRAKSTSRLDDVKSGICSNCGGNIDDDGASAAATPVSSADSGAVMEDEPGRQLTSPPSAECFVVTRGCQINERRLVRALDRVAAASGAASFGRVQFTTAASLVAENAAPSADLLLVHLGGHDLADAVHSVAPDGANASAVAASLARVDARQLARAAAARDPKSAVLVSLPLPAEGALMAADSAAKRGEFVCKFQLLRLAYCARLENACSGMD